MSSIDYQQRAAEVLVAAAAEPDRDVAARALLDAYRATPRFPSFAEELVRLVGNVVDPAKRPNDLGLIIDGLRGLLDLARIVGADPLFKQVGVILDELPDTDPRVDWLRALWRTGDAARFKGYAAAQDAYRIAASKAERLADDDLELDMCMIRLDVELRHDNRNAVLQQVERTLELLASRDETWDGERYHLENARNLLFTQRDDSEATRHGMEVALTYPIRHGAAVDSAQSVIALVPVLLHQGDAESAVGVVTEGIAALQAANGPAELEMPLWHLAIKTQEVRGNLKAAVETGFEAIARSGVNGTLQHYMNFTINVASLYFQAEMHVDAYHMLQTADRGLRKREDGAEFLGQIQQLREAMAADLGEARMAEVIDAWTRREAE